MKRTAGMCMILAILGGCTSADTGPGSAMGHHGGAPPMVPGVQGSWGQPVPMVAPYAYSPPSGAQLARAMMSSNVPLNMVQPGSAPSEIMQASATSTPGDPSAVIRAGGFTPPGMRPPMVMSPPGVPATPSDIIQTNVGGPTVPPIGAVPNAVAAVGAITGPGGPRFPTQRTEVRFVGPAGMKISWPDGTGVARGHQIEAPGRYNFIQGGVYRLKFTDLPGRPGVDLYPTLEIVPANLRTDAYIAHSAVPLYLTDEDIEQVLGGNFLVKVIYLPNPQYADAAVTGGPDEIVSTRLEPGLDPIAEACKRGSIMLILRVGNIDLEAPNTPSMSAPNPYQQQPGCPTCGPQGMPPVGPIGPMPPGMPMTTAPAGPMMGFPAAQMAPPPGPMMPGPMPPGAAMMMPGPMPAGPPMMPPGGPMPAVNGIPPPVPPRQAMPPVGKLPDSSGVRPVKYEEPVTAPTPAQLATGSW